MSDSTDEIDLDWEDNRLPEIKKELADHGYSVIRTSSHDVGRATTACLFWLGVFFAAVLIGAGASENRFMGAGIGVVVAMVLMLASEVYAAMRKPKRV